MKREMFGYVPGGYGRVLDAFQKHLAKLGVNVQIDSPVTAVTQISDGYQVQVRDASVASRFDRVIVTAPTKVAARMCVGLNEQERSRLDNIEYLGVICTSLLLANELGGYYVTNILDNGIPITGVIEMGSILPPEKMGGNYLVYLPQYMMADDKRFDDSDEVIHERCVATLEKMYPTSNART